MEIRELTQMMHELVAAKGWYDEDSPKEQTIRNLVISLAIEAAEVLEHVQWQETPVDTKEFADELADVGLFLLQLAHIAEIDLEQALLDKLAHNHQRNWE